MGTFTGTAGDDSIVGTDAVDVFHMEQGGTDTVEGGRGSDTFFFGDAFTADDRLDGGGGLDTLVIQGDYAAGLVINDQTLSHFEMLVLGEGYSYDLSGFTGHSVGSEFTVDARALGAGEFAHVDLSGVNTEVTMHGGGGDDLLIAGSRHAILDGGDSGADTLVGGAGDDNITLAQAVSNCEALAGAGDDYITAQLSADTTIDGGAGDDFLSLVGVYGAPLVFGAQTMTGIETLDIRVSGSLSLTLDDANVAAGAVLAIDASHIDGFAFDGSAEHDGRFQVTGAAHGFNTLTGGAGDDSLSGAGHADTLIGGAGSDLLTGYAGPDKLVGGAGADQLSGGDGPDRFFYLAVGDSTAGASDLIEDFGPSDILYLKPIDANDKKAGNQAFHIVDEFTHHRGELTVTADGGVTTVAGDVDGDGLADMVIKLEGRHLDASSFVL